MGRLHPQQDLQPSLQQPDRVPPVEEGYKLARMGVQNSRLVWGLEKEDFVLQALAFAAFVIAAVLAFLTDTGAQDLIGVVSVGLALWVLAAVPVVAGRVP